MEISRSPMKNQAVQTFCWWHEVKSGQKRACLCHQSLCRFFAAKEKSKARRVATSSMSKAPRFSRAEIPLPFMSAAKKMHHIVFWKPQKIIYGVIVFGVACRTLVVAAGRGNAERTYTGGSLSFDFLALLRQLRHRFD